MRKLLYLFLILISHLYAEEEIRLAAESEPLLTIADCINIYDGSFYQVDQDLAVEGPVSLSYTRYYDSGDQNPDVYKYNDYGYGVGLGYPLLTKIVATEKKGKAYVDQRHRYGLPFKLDHIDLSFGGGNLDPHVFKKGYTNCTEALERGSPSLAHVKMFVRKAGRYPDLKLYLSDTDETLRTYTFHEQEKEKHSTTYRYLLRKTTHTNGLATHYKYTNGRLERVELRNLKDKELLTFLDFEHDQQTNSYRVVSSDGRTVYHNMSIAEGYYNPQVPSALVFASVVKGLSADHLPLKVYGYDSPDGRTTYTNIARISYPEGRYLNINYQSDRRRATSLEAPVGEDQTPITLYKFKYEKEKTIVTNALGVNDTYHFANRRLERHDEAGLRSHVYKWGQDKGQLLSKTLRNSRDRVLETILYFYDWKGNIAQKWECGNITGNSPDDYSTRHEFNRKHENVRVKSFTYDMGQLVKETQPNGTHINYFYHLVNNYKSNLLKAKLTSTGNKVMEREFYSYDKNAILIEKIQDDGSTENINDLADVTYRIIKKIQPQMNRSLWGLTKPAVKEKYYLDLATGQEIFLKRTEIEYAQGGMIAKKRVYDATGAFAYEESYTYTPNLLVETMTDRLGRVVRYAYDANHNVIEEELVGSGKRTHKSYDYSNRLIEEKEIHDDGTLLTKTYTYDFMGNRTSMTDFEGNTSHYVYDTLNRKIQEIDPQGHVNSVVYDERDNPIELIDKEGQITRFKNNIDHHPLYIQYPDGTEEIFRYFVDGNLKSKQEKDGTSIVYTYDYRGRPLTETRNDRSGSTVATKTYLYKGDNLIEETDHEGHVTSYTYDSAKRMVAKTKAGIVESYAYDALGRPCTVEVGGKVKHQVFDSLKRVMEERTEDLQGNLYRKTTYLYDIFGNVTKTFTHTSDHEVETTTVYNSANLPTLLLDGLGHTTTITYTHQPLQKITVDPLDKTTIETFDALHRLVCKEVPGLSKQETIYSPNGHRIKQIDHIYQQGIEKGTSIVKWEYDPLGNIVTLIEQDLKTTRHTFQHGRLESTCKPDGVCLYHTYDPLGKLQEQWSSDGNLHVAYTYDRNGNMLSAEDKLNGQSVQRMYDAYGNITAETTHATLYYSYDEQQRLTEMRFPDESSITYTYNPLDMVSMTRQGKTHSYFYDLAGRLVQENTFDNTSTFYTYDDNHRITSIVAPYYQQTNSYDPAGNITSMVVNNNTTTYSYDGLYQLIAENTTIYSYDSLHNRLSKDGYQYKNNTLHQVLSDAENIYTYDPNGNRQTKNGISYTYDPLNHLTSANDISYTYDALGRLQSRTTPTSQESFFYFKDKELGSLDCLKILGRGIAGIEKQGTLYTVLKDHRSSPSVIFHDGHVVATYTYSAYGETTYEGTLHCPWQYAAYRFDPDTHLLHAPHRIYDPRLGRWLTPDPLGFADGPNLYAYVHNNPLIFIDPLGLWHEPLGFNGEQRSQFTYGRSAHSIRFADNFESGRYRSNSYDIKRFGYRDWRQGMVTFMNGMLTYKSGLISHSRYQGDLAGGLNIWGVHNATHGWCNDLGECCANRNHVATPPVRALHAKWDEFFSTAPKNIPLLHNCHSQGAIHTRNALMSYPEEFRKRIIVVAIAPAVFIDRELCKEVTHYVSKRDFVPFTDPFGMFRCRKDVIFLTPHRDAKWWDHDFQSPTYRDAIKDELRKYKQLCGEK